MHFSIINHRYERSAKTPFDRATDERHILRESILHSLDRVLPKAADIQTRRAALGLDPMLYGMAAYAIVRDTEEEAERELARITNVAPGSPDHVNYYDWIAHAARAAAGECRRFSVSGRGLRARIVGTPEQLAKRITEFEAAGVGWVLFQFSPQTERDGAVRGVSDAAGEQRFDSSVLHVIVFQGL